MAGIAFGGAAVGGGFALAAAAYQTSTGFTARHETTHAQQIEITRRYIAEFDCAYGRDEVSAYNWEKYLRLRESINAYKDVPTCNVIRKWKLKSQVRMMKKGIRQANRSLRLHYDEWQSSSSASDASSISAEYGSPPSSLAAHRVDDDTHISYWAKYVVRSVLNLRAEHLLDVHGYLADKATSESEDEDAINDAMQPHAHFILAQ